MGLVYIAQALLSHGMEVKIFDMRHHLSFLSLKKVLRTFHPEVIGLSLRNADNAAYPCVRLYLPYYLSIMKTIRHESQSPIILGGSGFSLFPEEMMELLDADAGVKGEGERSLVRIIKENSRGIISGEYYDPKEISSL